MIDPIDKEVEDGDKDDVSDQKEENGLGIDIVVGCEEGEGGVRRGGLVDDEAGDGGVDGDGEGDGEEEEEGES